MEIRTIINNEYFLPPYYTNILQLHPSILTITTQMTCCISQSPSPSPFLTLPHFQSQLTWPFSSPVTPLPGRVGYFINLLERIADLTTNIAEEVIYMGQDEISRHRMKEFVVTTH